jgi:predicted DNA-binding antitoxin AbrB/MazE fold protein
VPKRFRTIVLPERRRSRPRGLSGWLDPSLVATVSKLCYDRLMKETLKAVFENGVFRPLKRPKGLAERREVTLTVTVEEGQSSLADFAGRISSDDAQEMREVIEREFERVDPLEWR